jgi:anti-sigma regulatory factor (Ser/Thr protein kinase)
MADAEVFPHIKADRPVVREFPAHPSSLHAIREFVCDRAVEASIPTHDAVDLALAVSEAGTISVCQTDSSFIEITWSAGPDRIEVSVRDDGVYFPDASLKRPESMGLALIRALVDEFDFHEGTEASPGNRTRLVKFQEARG